MTERITAIVALLGALAAMVGAAVGYGRSQERIDATGAAVSSLSQRADGTEARLRAVEQAQVGTAQALKDIADNVRDIKDALKK